MWREHACVVVTEDLPSGTVLDANRHARHAGIQGGMRFAAALSLAPGLRAGVVSPEERNEVDGIILESLYRFSPEVESFRYESGVFYLGIGGMGRLFSSPAAWARSCREAVHSAGFRSCLAVGWSRVGTYVASKTNEREITIFPSEGDEKLALERASLSVLPLGHRDRERLNDLGISTVGDFRALSEGGVQVRFGRETADIHAFLTGSVELPISTVRPERKRNYTAACIWPVQNQELLFPYVEELLQRAAEDLKRNGKYVVAISIDLVREDGTIERHAVRPARPTGDIAFLMKLIRIRLTERPVPRENFKGVTRCTLDMDTTVIVTRQGDLFPWSTRRDGERVAAAVSLLRARFGNEIIGRFVPTDGFLPEERITWETVDGALSLGSSHSPSPSLPDAGDRRPLVRRIFFAPVPLHTKDGACRAGGPYLLSGRWWANQYRREYSYFETHEGRLLWAYREGEEGAWMLQGFVE